MPPSIHLKQIIQNGENAAVEFKSAAVSTDGLAKEMVAFSNSQGGMILIGVEDDGTITGIDKAKQNEAWISNIARDAVLPPILVQTSIESIGEQEILVVEVPKGKNRPYQTRNDHFYIRVGSTNRRPSLPELMRLFQQGGTFHYDATAVDKSKISDLNLYKIASYFTAYGLSFEEEADQARLLRNVDVLTETDEVTVAGLLMFGINPQKYLHNACISFAQFRGTEMADELLNHQVIGGTLDQQVDTTLALIKNSIPAGSTIQGAKTVPTRPSYEDRIFRELLVNAVVHRNYAIEGSRIRILLFQDRIEFRSPGRLPNTITIEKLSAGVSYAVNPILLKFMENLRYVDKLGRGLPMVWNAAKQLGRPIAFNEIAEEFVVTLGL